MKQHELYSSFAENIIRFTECKNSLGYPYEESIRMLRNFNIFCCKHFPYKSKLDKTRVVPLMPKTVLHLKHYLSKQYPDYVILICCDGASWNKANVLCVPKNMPFFNFPIYA